MKFDLQDLWRANPKAVIAGAVVILAAFSLLVVKGVTSSSGHKHTATRAAVVTKSTSTTSATAGTSTVSGGVTTPSASYHPSYTPVPSTPADQKLAAAEEQSGADIARYEGITPPSPAWTSAYPSLSPKVWHTEERYAAAFVQELLDRNYRTQTRGDLGRWLSAESASDELPGVPSSAGQHQLYADAMDPQAVDEGASPVPTAAEWDQRAQADERQHAFGIFVNPSASWEKSVAGGVTSRDPLLDVQDVTGLLSTTSRGGKAVTRHFSMELFVGSALHHPGYGSWGFDEWEVQ